MSKMLLSALAAFFCLISFVTTAVATPGNDAIANAVTLSSSTVCSNMAGTVAAATSSGISVNTCAGTPDDDVWYKFIAQASNTTISLSSMATSNNSLGKNDPVVEIFLSSSGNSSTLSYVSCASANNSATLVLTVSTLTAGATYYVRVFSKTTGAPSSDGSFNICVTHTESLPANSYVSGRMNEVFQQTTLSAANVLLDPWEITYGPDGFLWITEAKGYKVYKMDPNTGAKTTVLDISQSASGFLSAAEHSSFNVQFATGSSPFSPWPQGGLAGLALHPQFMHASAPKNFVYISYVHSHVSGTSSSTSGVFFKNRIVRFTYNSTSGLLENPVSLCDTLPGSNDHNSQRMIVAHVAGTYYLFYASGDMGAGQYSNLSRPIFTQVNESYEGKILRFNLEEDSDVGTLDRWIPNDNPFNGTVQSAVWSTGMRNNQGFAYASINGTDYLYGSSHGPFSDDEINIIEKNKNHGHPLVIGYSGDGNYDGAKAGPASGSLPLISSEAANAASIGASYSDPLYTFYSPVKGNISTTGTIQYIYNQVNSGNGANASWPSEAPAGMDLYTGSFIPGWKNSLIVTALKGGKVIRLKLNSSGNGTTATNGSDTVGYFRSVNRFRDLAISLDGKSIFTVIDRSSTTSGPTTGSPVVSACAGCVLKYTFLGYQNNGGKSSIPSAIEVAAGIGNAVNAGSTITIDGTNNMLWVPITGEDGNIVAEIKANGNNLGTVTTSFYTHGGTVREDGSKRLYANRNITIIPQTQPSSAVSIRLYLTNSEFVSLASATNSQGVNSGVTSISHVQIRKNSDACLTAIAAATTAVVPTYAEAHGTNGYVLQADINSFSSFYFGNPEMNVLPLQLLSFKGNYQNNSVLLRWETTSETNTSHFVIERSFDGRSFREIGTTAANGHSSTIVRYSFSDHDIEGASTIHYKLRMVDQDGTSTYSSIISIQCPAPSIAIQVHPNPIEHTVFVKIYSAKKQDLQIEVSDMNGRIIESAKRSLNAGNNQVQVDATLWPAQTYIIKVFTSDGKLSTSRTIIKK